MDDLRPGRPWESDKAAMFRDMVRRFILSEAAPRGECRCRQKFVDRDFRRQTGELGMLCPSMPEEYGGTDGDYSLEAVVSEEMADAGIASFMQVIHGDNVARYIDHHSDTDKQCQVIDECLHLHGGYGCMPGYPIACMFADTRVQRICGGANGIMKEIIARSLS